jgi:predicted esterase
MIWILSLSAFLCAEEELRTWTRKGDGKTLEAKLLTVDENKVNLQMKGGREVSLELAILSDLDRKWLAEWQAAEKAANEVAAEMQSHETEGVAAGSWHVRYPQNVPVNRRGERPLCVLYSPSGKSQSVMKRVELAADQLGWILVGIDAYSNARAKESNHEVLENTQKVFAEVQKAVPHSKDKVIFGGMSGGALWSYISSAQVYPETAAILAFGGWMGNAYDRSYPRRMTVAMVNGDNDTGAKNYEEPDEDFLRKTAKAEVKVFHFPGGHEIAPPEVVAVAASWIHGEAGFDPDDAP